MGGGAFLAIASPMHVLELASFASRLGEAQGSPPRYTKNTEGALNRTVAWGSPVVTTLLNSLCFLVELGRA
jgi:uncharacterized protein YbjT (DUF2867 family)